MLSASVAESRLEEVLASPESRLEGALSSGALTPDSAERPKNRLRLLFSVS
jgi:hypothetical protein